MTLQKKNSDENKENIRIAFIYTMGEYVVPQLINKYSLSPSRHNVTFSFTQGTSLTLAGTEGREKRPGDLFLYCG